MKSKANFVRSWTGLMVLSVGSMLCANPTDPNVISGDVSFSNPAMDTLVVTSTDDRSIVEWDTFSIGANETTTFDLPNATSAILNRVTAEESISQILGSITSNGQVFLINPNGILVDNGAIISTGAFLASTMDVDNTEFLNNDAMTFTTTDNTDISLYNYGEITADSGDVILLGYQVINRGDISAEEAVAGLGAGVEIVFQPTNDPRLTIVSGTASTQFGSGVDLQGSVAALRSEIKADGNFYQFAINIDGNVAVSGGISGTSLIDIESPNGLVQINGTLSSSDNSGAYGGMMQILGNNIQIGNGSGATISTAATYGNGLIYIGGGYQGGDATNLFHAQEVLFDTGATLDCSAVSAGNGGLVVIWADDTTHFLGSASLTGGSGSGDGGTIQVVGVEHLYNYGSIDVSAPAGNSGTTCFTPTCN